jgi:hypothetical protein
LNCTNAGDAAVGWAPEGYGLVAGPGVSSTNPTCSITHRIICADLTP